MTPRRFHGAIPPSPSRLAAAAAAAFLGLVAAACSPEAEAALIPVGDLCPPILRAAGPTGERAVALAFDEPVTPVPESLGLEPRLAFVASASGETLGLELGDDMSPGREYRLAGEVEDASGNRTRFVVAFPGWNARPAVLRLSEVQTAKNSSKTKPRRDFAEFLCETSGNVGGLELEWASSVRSAVYRFPGCEVGAGDYLVLHLAPEGTAEEKDETGGSLAASGGADAAPGARDLWCGAMPLPDESGILVLRDAPGGKALDGLWYSSAEKAGALGDGDARRLAAELGGSGLWPAAASDPAWEDAFRWKPSSARSICRSPGAARGPGAWYAADSGAQTPGEANAPPATDGARGRRR